MSKKNLIRPQYEEFWDDCIKLSPKKHIKFNETSINNKTIPVELQKNNNNKIIFSQKNNSVKNKNNHRLIKKVLTTEESITKNIEKRKQKQIKILSSIYNNHLIKKKKIQKETIKLKENLILKEKKIVHLNPSIIQNIEALVKNTLKIQIIIKRYMNVAKNLKIDYTQN